MTNIKNSIQSIISNGYYNADKLVDKIQQLWLSDQLTDAERDDLMDAAYENAKDQNQIDMLAKLTDIQSELAALSARIYTLEHANDPEPEPVSEYVTYYSGYVTSKGETVLFDYDDDGALDLLRYDGGKAQTTLSPGKISGWHVIDSEGNVLGDYYKGQFTPVQQEEEPEQEPEQEVEPEIEPEQQDETEPE